MTLQRSALHPIATAAGGHFQERFGWELPRVYADPALEYRAATEAVAVHDASYVGRLKATGRDVLDLLNRISTNRVLSLQPGQGAPTILTTDRGRILDLIAVVNTGDYILLITSPGNQQRIIDWLDKYTIMEDVTVQDVTSSDTMLAVLGPGSQTALEALSGVRLDSLQPFHSVVAEIPPTPLFERGARGDFYSVRLIRRHLGVLPSFDLLVPPDGAPGVWQALVESGATPLGVEALDAVRVRYAVPSYGRELGEAFNPLEAGLIGSIDFAKGCYIGQEVIARLDTYHKVQRYLVTLRFPSDTQVAEGVTLRQGERSVGAITSLARIPTTGQVIGLGYVRAEAAALGARLDLEEIPGGWAEVEGLPQMFGPGKG